MAQILVPSRRIWTRQPQSEAPGISPAHPLAPWLVSATISGIEQTTKSRLTVKVGVWPRIVNSRDSSGLLFDGMTVLESSAVKYVPPPFTLILLIKKSASQTECLASFGGSGGTGRGWRIGSQNNASSLYLTYGGYAASYDEHYELDASFFTIGKPTLFGVSVSGSEARRYRNGQYVGVTNSIGTPTTPINPFTLGAAHTGSVYTDYSSSEIYSSLLFRSALTDHQHAEIARNSWQMFQPRRRVAYFDLGAGGIASVYGDNAVAYAIREMLSSDSGIEYAIRNAIYQDDAVGYYLRASVAQNSAIGYVLRSAIAKDATAAYLMRGLVQTDDSEAYSLRGLVQTSDNETYTVRSAVSANTSAVYDVLSSSSVASNSTVSYSIRGTVTANSSPAYAVRSAAQSDQVIGYSLRSFVSRDVASVYGVASSESSVYSDLAASYSVDGVPPDCPTAESIAAAVVSALQGTTIPVDTKKMNGSTIYGNGTSGDKWRGNV